MVNMGGARKRGVDVYSKQCD